MSSPAPLSALGPSIGQSKFIRIAAVAVIVLGCARMLNQVSFFNFSNDFSHYYIGASIYANGGCPYTEHLAPYCEQYNVPFDPVIPYAAHPPLIQWWFSRLTIFPMPIAFGIWLGVQMMLLGGCIETARRLTRFQWSDPAWLLLVGVFLNSTAVQSLIYYAQVQMFIGLIAYLALSSHLKGRSPMACALITLISAFKIYPVVLAPWFLFAGVKQVRDLRPRLAAMAGMSIFCLTLPGFQTWIDFVNLGVPTLADNAHIWRNYSLQNFIAFALGDFGRSSTWIKTLASTLSVAFIASAYIVVYAKKLAPREAFSLILIAATFGGIIAWSHYMTLMFLPVCLLASHAMKQPQRAYRYAAVLASVLIWSPKLDETFFQHSEHLTRVLLHFYPLFGITILIALLISDGPLKSVSQKGQAANPSSGLELSS